MSMKVVPYIFGTSRSPFLDLPCATAAAGKCTNNCPVMLLRFCSLPSMVKEGPAALKASTTFGGTGHKMRFDKSQMKWP